MQLSSPASLKLKIWHEISTILSPWKMYLLHGARLGLGVWHLTIPSVSFDALDSFSVQQISNECQLFQSSESCGANKWISRLSTSPHRAYMRTETKPTLLSPLNSPWAISSLLLGLHSVSRPCCSLFCILLFLKHTKLLPTSHAMHLLFLSRICSPPRCLCNWFLLIIKFSD